MGLSKKNIKMKKYIQTDKLQKLIDWENIMKMDRSAGGHDAQMQGLFKGAKLIAHWNEGDYQGMVATCVKLPDGRFAIYNDYYGSCYGCDAWAAADNESVRRMCIALANSAYVFKKMKDVKEYLSNPEQESDWSSWSSSAQKLLYEINKKKTTQ